MYLVARGTNNIFYITDVQHSHKWKESPIQRIENQRNGCWRKQQRKDITIFSLKITHLTPSLWPKLSVGLGGYNPANTI